MPGFAVHYLFGQNTLVNYSRDELYSSIEKHKEMFNLGLQGPDLFFYYFLSPILYKKNIGSILHTKKIGQFKKNFLYVLINEKDDDRKKVGIAYFAGFLGHCTLDQVCHPYIYAMTDYEHKGKGYFSKHVDFETEMDAIYTKRYMNIDLYDFRRKEEIRLTELEINTLAEMFVRAFKRTYPNVKLNKKRMKFIINIFKESCYIFNDKTGLKKKLVGKLESLILKKKVISPMFIEKNRKNYNFDILNTDNEEWVNPWDKSIKRTESFDELFNKSIELYERILKELNKTIIEGKVGDESIITTNLSLHSGLDCSIPSWFLVI